MIAKSQLSVSIEGVDDEGRVQLGEAASLVIEGVVAEKYVPEDCTVLVQVATGQGKDRNEAEFSLNVEDFLSGPGPFLCQIDFEAETVGEMSFAVTLKHGKAKLAKDEAVLRVVNLMRDPSGKRRKQGPGALKVKK